MLCYCYLFIALFTKLLKFSTVNNNVFFSFQNEILLPHPRNRSREIRESFLNPSVARLVELHSRHVRGVRRRPSHDHGGRE